MEIRTCNSGNNNIDAILSKPFPEWQLLMTEALDCRVLVRKFVFRQLELTSLQCITNIKLAKLVVSLLKLLAICGSIIKYHHLFHSQYQG